MRTKKAISPLIASVLLIVVVLAIGAVVTGIARNYITAGKQEMENAKADLKCATDLEITIPHINGDYRICKMTDISPNRLNITVRNTGSVRVDDIQVKVFGSKGFVTNDSVLPEGMPTGKMLSVSVEYDEDAVGKISQINIVPRLKKVGQTEKLFCIASQIVFADLPECN